MTRDLQLFCLLRVPQPLLLGLDACAFRFLITPAPSYIAPPACPTPFRRPPCCRSAPADRAAYPPRTNRASTNTLRSPPARARLRTIPAAFLSRPAGACRHSKRSRNTSVL